MATAGKKSLSAINVCAGMMLGEKKRRTSKPFRCLLNNINTIVSTALERGTEHKEGG